MEIAASSLALSLPSSIPKRTVHLPPLSLSFSSSLSSGCTSTCTFFKKARVGGGIGSHGWRRSRESRNRGLSCKALFGLGVPELVVIAGVAALVFGPKKLPEVGKSIGKTVKSFQQAAKEFESEIKKEPASTEEGPVEKPVAVSEQEKQDVKVSSSKESV